MKLVSVKRQVRTQVKDQVWSQVRVQVKDQVWSQVWDQVRYKINKIKLFVKNT